MSNMSNKKISTLLLLWLALIAINIQAKEKEQCASDEKNNFSDVKSKIRQFSEMNIPRFCYEESPVISGVGSDNARYIISKSKPEYLASIAKDQGSYFVRFKRLIAITEWGRNKDAKFFQQLMDFKAGSHHDFILPIFADLYNYRLFLTYMMMNGESEQVPAAIKEICAVLLEKPQQQPALVMIPPVKVEVPASNIIVPAMPIDPVVSSKENKVVQTLALSKPAVEVAKAVTLAFKTISPNDLGPLPIPPTETPAPTPAPMPEPTRQMASLGKSTPVVVINFNRHPYEGHKAKMITITAKPMNFQQTVEEGEHRTLAKATFLRNHFTTAKLEKKYLDHLNSPDYFFKDNSLDFNYLKSLTDEEGKRQFNAYMFQVIQKVYALKFPIKVKEDSNALHWFKQNRNMVQQYARGKPETVPNDYFLKSLAKDAYDHLDRLGVHQARNFFDAESDHMNMLEKTVFMHDTILNTVDQTPNFTKEERARYNQIFAITKDKHVFTHDGAYKMWKEMFTQVNNKAEIRIRPLDHAEVRKFDQFMLRLASESYRFAIKQAGPKGPRKIVELTPAERLQVEAYLNIFEQAQIFYERGEKMGLGVKKNSETMILMTSAANNLKRALYSPPVKSVKKADPIQEERKQKLAKLKAFTEGEITFPGPENL